MGIVQEKFQVNEPWSKEQDSRQLGENKPWVSDRSARAKKGVPGREGHKGGDWASKTTANTALYNSLPPGMDIADQELSDIRVQDFGGSMGTGTQATDDVTAMALREGFDRKSLRPTDDMYTREHNDSFYDSIVVDGVEGYVERNNMLDRM